MRVLEIDLLHDIFTMTGLSYLPHYISYIISGHLHTPYPRFIAAYTELDQHAALTSFAAGRDVFAQAEYFRFHFDMPDCHFVVMAAQRDEVAYVCSSFAHSAASATLHFRLHTRQDFRRYIEPTFERGRRAAS